MQPPQKVPIDVKPTDYKYMVSQFDDAVYAAGLKAKNPVFGNFFYYNLNG
jgi:hypothetical protein